MAQSLKRVLIVEDDLSLRPLWENFFKNNAVKILLDWAVSCEQAIVMITDKNKQRKKYHLIVSDLFLAGAGTGIDLMRSKPVLDSGAKTVLVSSASRDQLVSQFAHMIPETEIITKPLDLKKCEFVMLQRVVA